MKKKLQAMLSRSVWENVFWSAMFPAILLLPSCQSAIRFSSASRAGTSVLSSPSPSETVKSRANSSPAHESRSKNPSSNVNSTRYSIIESAERWLGTPYRYGSMERDGTDCSGFVMRVYEEQGIRIPRSTKDQFTSGMWIDMQNVTVGDLLFFNTNGAGVSHVGIYAGNDTVIHASSKSGVVRQSLSDTYLAKTFLGARRILGIEEVE